VEKVNTQIESIRNEVQLTKDELISVREISSERESEYALTFAGMQSTVERSVESSASIQAKIQECESRRQILLSEIATIEERARPLHEQIIKQESVVEEAVTAFRRLSRRRNRKFEELVEATHDWEIEHAGSREGIQGLEAAVDKAKRDLQVAEAQSQSEVAALHCEMSSIQRELLQLNSKLENVRAKKKECCDRRNSVKQQYESRRSDWERVQQEIDACACQLRSFETRQSRLDDDIDRTKKRIFWYAKNGESEIDDVIQIGRAHV
jgi:chromosome segregation ATPase